MQRVIAFFAAVEDQVFADFHLLGGDEVQRADFRHVDDGAGHAGLYRMVEEHRVEHGAGGGVEAEADVREPEDDLDLGELVTDHANALQGPQAELAVIFVAGADGEGQWVDHQVALRQAVLAAGEFDQPGGDFQLVLGGFGHADLVDGQRDHRGTEFLGELHAVMRRILAFLEVDRVDDRFSPVQLQRRLDDRGFGAVDHQR